MSILDDYLKNWGDIRRGLEMSTVTHIYTHGILFYTNTRWFKYDSLGQPKIFAQYCIYGTDWHTRCFFHRYWRRSTIVFTTSIQGTHARAITTNKDWIPIYWFKQKEVRLYTKWKALGSISSLTLNSMDPTDRQGLSPVHCREPCLWGHCSWRDTYWWKQWAGLGRPWRWRHYRHPTCKR